MRLKLILIVSFVNLVLGMENPKGTGPLIKAIEEAQEARHHALLKAIEESRIDELIEQLEKDIQQEKAALYLCTVCHEAFKTKEELKTHTKTHEQKCPECNNIYIKLLNHIKASHPQLAEEIDRALIKASQKAQTKAKKQPSRNIFFEEKH